MQGENNVKRGQIRGWLFEAVLRILLEKSGFDMVRPDPADMRRERMERRDFVEIKGRGDWHQIDLPFDYPGSVPFLYPVRLLGEAKYLKTVVDKDLIRNFIGVMKDIQENYFVDDSLSEEMVKGRRMELGAFFSANGFSDQAERLSYAHGIRTVSYRNNAVVDGLRRQIDALEQEYLPYVMLTAGGVGDFLADFRNAMGESGDLRHFRVQWGIDPGAGALLDQMKAGLQAVKSSFFASTDTGVLLHFLGTEAFPYGIFGQRDEAGVRVKYERVRNENRYYMEFCQMDMKCRYYFTPPRFIGKAALYGTAQTPEAGAPLRLFMKINGVQRSLTIRMEQDWLDADRELNMTAESY